MEKNKCVTKYRAVDAEEYAALQAKCERYEKALNKIRYTSRVVGQPDSTWCDTDFDSMAVAAGYNQALDNILPIANEAISGEGEKEVLNRGLRFYSKTMAGHIIEVLKVNKEAGTFNVMIKPTNEIGGVSWTDLWSIEGFDKYYKLGNYTIIKEDKQ